MSIQALLLVADSLGSLRISHASAKQLDEMRSIQARLREWERRYVGAAAPATLRALRSDWQKFIAWCERRDVAPLPLSMKDLVRFVNDMVEEGLKRSTLDRYIWAVREIHVAAGLPLPTDHPDWRLEFKGIARRLGELDRNGKRQAEPLKDSGVQSILESLENAQPQGPTSSLVRKRQLRDAALIALASDTLCRESELVVVAKEDLSPSSNGAYSLKVKKSKGDQEQKGSYRFVSAETHARIEAWCKEAEIEEGFIFLPVGGRKKLSGPPHMRAREVAIIIRRRATQSGLEKAARLSGHSARVGSVIDLIEGGEGYTAAAYAGGWKSEAMVRRYAEQAEAGINAMARVRSKQRRGRPVGE